jgi:hypothetical protein
MRQRTDNTARHRGHEPDFIEQNAAEKAPPRLTRDLFFIDLCMFKKA